MFPTDFPRRTSRKYSGGTIREVLSSHHIHRTHSIDEAMSEMAQSNVAGAVFVQCYSDCPEEIDWVYSQVETQPRVLGVVGGLDLVKHEKVSQRLRVEYEPPLPSDESFHREVSESPETEVCWCASSDKF